MCIFHKWGKWEQYEQTMANYVYKTGKTYPYVEKRQKRTCEKCNKVQDEIVGE